MPIDEYNCVELTVQALKLKFGRNLRARLKAPSRETIDRYIRSCRKHNQFQTLISEIARLNLLTDIPIIVLFSRPYKVLEPIVAELTDISGVVIYDRPLQCPITLDLFNKDPNNELIFREESPSIPPESDRHPSNGSITTAEAPPVRVKFTFG